MNFIIAYKYKDSERDDPVSMLVKVDALDVESVTAVAEIYANENDYIVHSIDLEEDVIIEDKTTKKE